METTKIKAEVKAAEATDVTDGVNNTDIPTWLVLPEALKGASAKALADRYHELAEMKLAGETAGASTRPASTIPKDVERTLWCAR